MGISSLTAYHISSFCLQHWLFALWWIIFFCLCHPRSLSITLLRPFSHPLHRSPLLPFREPASCPFTSLWGVWRVAISCCLHLRCSRLRWRSLVSYELATKLRVSCLFSCTKQKNDHLNILRVCYIKVKVARTRLPGVGFRSWSRYFAVSLQVAWVINPAVGCHYFPPGLRLPILLLGEQRHNGCEQFA